MNILTVNNPRHERSTPNISGKMPGLAQTSSILVLVLNVASVASSGSNARKKQDPFQPETLAFPCLV